MRENFQHNYSKNYIYFWFFFCFCRLRIERINRFGIVGSYIATKSHYSKNHFSIKCIKCNIKVENTCKCLHSGTLKRLLHSLVIFSSMTLVSFEECKQKQRQKKTLGTKKRLFRQWHEDFF